MTEDDSPRARLRHDGWYFGGQQGNVKRVGGLGVNAAREFGVARDFSALVAISASYAGL